MQNFRQILAQARRLTGREGSRAALERLRRAAQVDEHGDAMERELAALELT